MKRGILFVALFACACPSKPGGPSTGTGTGTNQPTGSLPAACQAQRGKVEQLYRAEAQVKEPSRVDEAMADNTAMVMNDCAKQPDKVAPCVAKATSVAEIEAQCLVPLDDEGTEGIRR
jgi:hypothetical protein